MGSKQEQGAVRHRTPAQENKRRLLPHEEPDDPDWPYAHGNLDPLGKFIGLSVMVVSLSLVGYFRYQQYLRDIVITPLEAPRIVAANATSASVSPERFWGTYRPHTYFGLQTRSPDSPVFGAMWLQQFTNTTPPPLRHWCDPDDGLRGSGWLQHDGTTFGIQELEDEGFTVKTELVKRAGGQHGGDWTARMTVFPKNTDQEVVVSSLFYVALDGQGTVQPVFTDDILTLVAGHTQQLGSFHLTFPKPKNSSSRNSHLIAYASNLAQLTEIVKSGMKEEVWSEDGALTYMTLGGQTTPQKTSGVNFIVKEVTATLPFEMEVVFESGSFQDRPDTLAGTMFDHALAKHVQDFNRKFSETFQLKEKGLSEAEIGIAKAALSNVLGSVGYYHGSTLVQSDYNKEPVKYWKAPLFLSLPSRSFSPHGSLWDEGFHNLLISRWAEGLSLEVLGHWLDLVNTEGWIPPQQIVGEEMGATTRAGCAIQHDSVAAPPSMFLPLHRLIPKLAGSSRDPAHQQYLTALYPRLKAWYAWYNSSVCGRMLSSSHVWRRHDEEAAATFSCSAVASELKNCPQASHPAEDELHEDLSCWMVLASGVMAELAKAVEEDWQDYADTHRLLMDKVQVDHLHWSERGQQYSDFGLHADEVKLGKASPHFKLKDQFVNAFGSVSLFPFLFKTVDPHSPKLYRILTGLKDPALLWSQYGLRSLACNSSFYQHTTTEGSLLGDVWLNMNFQTLAALHHYSHSAGPYSQLARDVYSELRGNLVKNTLKEFQRTGYFWEYYSDTTGEGKGRHPFTGSSALIVLIMADVY